MNSPLVKKNNKLALVCTGTTGIKADVLATVNYLQQHYPVKVIYQEDTYQMLSAQQRAQIFMDYLADPEIKAIWSYRGGEGSADILPYLQTHYNHIHQMPPTILLGFSDFTPILVYFSQNFSWPVLHACSARQCYLETVNKTCEQTTVQWLLGKENNIIINDLKPLNDLALQPLTLQAQVSGGNLSLLDISIADCWHIQPQEKILLLEDVNEKPHRIARLLKYLLRIGTFEKVKAIILAGYYFDEEGTHPTLHKQYNQSITKVLKRFASACSCPVLLTQQVSHGLYNLPIPFYTPATLVLSPQPRLMFSQETSI